MLESGMGSGYQLYIINSSRLRERGWSVIEYVSHVQKAGSLLYIVSD